ncbi:MAG: imidazole glycerol phosphate synthase subunit HisF [Chloroflexi bacterium]|nr:imidazole glycerol phosphate synthase subunit HisF [Chloroflexota bacterium]
MLTKRVIPCLDVKAGRVVKGVRFLDHRDAGDPVEMAALYNRQGADELVFYDITASADRRGIMLDVVSRVAEQVFIPLTVGGGLRTVADMQQMLQAGADKVSINTAAVEDPDLISRGADHFGNQCIVLGLDAMRISSDGPPRWEVRVRTGRDSGDRTSLDAVEWAARAAELGAGEVVVNSMDSDGTLDGYDLELLRAISESVTIPVVASGGAGNPQHMFEAVTEGQADAALAASIFHYSTYTVGEAKDFLADHGLPVRPSPRS